MNSNDFRCLKSSMHDHPKGGNADFRNQSIFHIIPYIVLRDLKQKQHQICWSFL